MYPGRVAESIAVFMNNLVDVQFFKVQAYVGKQKKILTDMRLYGLPRNFLNSFSDLFAQAGCLSVL